MNYLMDNFARVNVALVRGEGSIVYDEAGKDYVDFGAGIGVNCLGHANEIVLEAIGKLRRSSTAQISIEFCLKKPWLKRLASFWGIAVTPCFVTPARRRMRRQSKWRANTAP